MLRPAHLVLATLLTVASALVAPALAHTGIGQTTGLVHGFVHPFGGVDHVLAMVAVGLFAGLLGGRSLWLVPASFAVVMAAGGALGIAGIGIPFVETGIALSLAVLGVAVALRVPMRAAVA